MLWHKKSLKILPLFYLFKTHLHLFYSLFCRKRRDQIRIHSRIYRREFELSWVPNFNKQLNF
jgi:hypothetical protein